VEVLAKTEKINRNESDHLISGDMPEGLKITLITICKQD
jgi:hypothetical protein